MAFFMGYAALRSDVKHQSEDIATMKVQMDRVYTRLLWNERSDMGEQGPRPK